jgi:hypothetical protein
MTPAELSTNIRHFTTGMRGARTRPCTHLTLSGVGRLEVDVEQARQLGIRTVTLHGRAPSATTSAVDRVVRRVSAPSDLESWPAHPSVTAIVPVDGPALSGAGAWVPDLLARAPADVVFWWPYPDGTRDRPSSPELAGHVTPLRHRLEAAGIRTRLGGLPPCLLEAGSIRGRTSNRYYVDADHQREQALLFFPDVVAMAKPDSCRVCWLTATCDGVPRRWLQVGGLGLLQPIADPRPGG